GRAQGRLGIKPPPPVVDRGQLVVFVLDGTGMHGGRWKRTTTRATRPGRGRWSVGSGVVIICPPTGGRGGSGQGLRALGISAAMAGRFSSVSAAWRAGSTITWLHH